MRTRKPLTEEEQRNRHERAIRRKKDLDYRAFLRRIILISVSATVVAAVWLFNFFLPFRTLVSGYALPAREAGELRVHFLDIGQGDATLFEFPEGDCILIDTGDGSFENEEHLFRYIKGVAPTSLTVVLTHTDLDHSGGLSFLMQYCSPAALYVPSACAFALDTDVPLYRYSRYDVLLGSGGAYAMCISPLSEEEKADNDVSGVFYVNYQGTTFLMGGDISTVREHRLMREYALDSTLFDRGDYCVRLDDVDILKVSHHGSAYSSAEDWLSLIAPEVAIISCGAGNSYGHPTSEALSRLGEVSEIYRTDELGDIVISVTANGYSIME